MDRMEKMQYPVERRIKQKRFVCGVCGASFLMGSPGRAVGEKIIPEFGGVNQEKAPVISAYLKRMSGKNPQEIVEERYRRFRKM